MNVVTLCQNSVWLDTYKQGFYFVQVLECSSCATWPREQSHSIRTACARLFFLWCAPLYIISIYFMEKAGIAPKLVRITKALYILEQGEFAL